MPPTPAVDLAISRYHNDPGVSISQIKQLTKSRRKLPQAAAGIHQLVK